MNEIEFSSQSFCDVVKIFKQRVFHSLALWNETDNGFGAKDVKERHSFLLIISFILGKSLKDMIITIGILL